MSFPANTAGGWMHIDTITIRDDVTLDIVLRYLRMTESLPEHTDSLTIVDHKNHYIGTLSLIDILTHPRRTPVKSLIDTDVKVIGATLPESKVARLFEDFDLVSAPVVDKSGIFLGHITVDDVIDVIRKQAQQAEFTAAGLSMDEGLFSPVKASAKRRSLWLGVNLMTAFLRRGQLVCFKRH